MNVPNISGNNPDSQKGLVFEAISYKNWVEAPGVGAIFSIAHDGKNILLDFQVHELHVRAHGQGYFMNVWEDSCVEMFISFEEDGDNYYNFEFNPIGAVYAAYGRDRMSREILSLNAVEAIQTEGSRGNEPFELRGEHEWKLQVTIPIDSLEHTPLENLQGLSAIANFYKCGDRLDQPHYLSWNKVDWPTPDYHRPEFFAPLSFE